MNRDLRIALISPEFPPSSIGGIATVCNDVAWNLSKKRVSTTVFCGRSNKMSIEHLNSYLKVVRLPLLDAPPRHVWFQLQNFGLFRNLLSEYDVVHGADVRSSAFLAFQKRRLKRPFVTHVHGCHHCEASVFLHSPVSYWSPGDFLFTILEFPMNDFLARLALNHSCHAVVCSKNRLHEMKKFNSNLDFGKVSVIYNGIDFEKINSESKFVDEQDCSILYWGRLYYNKGIMQLINAMALVKNEFPLFSLDICGKGPLEARIRSLVKKLGLSDNIRISGYVSNKGLIEKIRTATSAVLPSLYAGKALAALVALAYKKPVIMYDFPFAREYVTDWHNGFRAKGGVGGGV